MWSMEPHEAVIIQQSIELDTVLGVYRYVTVNSSTLGMHWNHNLQILLKMY